MTLGATMGVRLARDDELATLQEIERQADALFATIGMPEVASLGVMELSVLDQAQRRGRLWVATDELDRPLGFAAAIELDIGLHLAQLSVHPAHMRKGWGTRLLETACAYAIAGGFHVMTLSSFRDVPWNAPFYQSRGFRPIPETELTPDLRALREHERSLGLDIDRRVVMRRVIYRE